MNKQKSENREVNAFVVTRVGQIRNVHNFIRQFGSRNNLLVMMYTPKDSVLLMNMQNACRTELFEDIIYLKLPQKPVRLTRSKGARMYGDIEEVMLRMKERYGVTQLFLCNINNYYIYFQRINETRGLDMKLNLLEEGLTTYKITSEEGFEISERHVNISDVKKSGRLLFRSVKRTVKDLFRIFVNSGIVLIQGLSFICGMNLTDRFVRKFTELTVPEKYRYDYIREVDGAYLCFPEMAGGAALDIKHIEKLEFQFSHIENREAIKQLEGFSNLFINQKYVNYESHFNIMFRIFREMGLDNVLIKLHPKEKMIDVVRKIEPLKEEYPEIRVRIIGDMGQVPVEDLVKEVHLQRVIGLTSSALIYLDRYIPGTEVISTAMRYRKLCETEEQVPLRELAQFDDEYRFFRSFEGIPQFEPEEVQE